MPDLRRRPLLHAAIIALVCATSLAANVRLSEPPRYDGAGYAVLARSILQERDYREIDHPDAPRHAHFPPGYPLALAAVWSMTGPSFAWAHAFSFACTLAATLLAWVWFRSWSRPGVALLMALALAVNWRWAKEGTAIRSEPLFLLLGQASLLASLWVAWRGGSWRAAALGVMLGLVVLTRHVGLALVVAVCVELWTRGRRREMVIALTGVVLVLARWVAWLICEGRNTQIGLVPVRERLTATILGNGLFYVRRLIDQLIGPVVEVGTVFRPTYAIPVTIFAAVACGVMVFGWVRLETRRTRCRARFGAPSLQARPLPLRERDAAQRQGEGAERPATSDPTGVAERPMITGHAAPSPGLRPSSPPVGRGRGKASPAPRRRLACAAGLVPLFTLALLLVWPFTEAGRFLVPLIPFVIAGLVEGLAAIAMRHGIRRHARLLAAIVVLLISLPYATYAIATHRADAERATHRDFDAACVWIAAHDDPPGTVLSRHPGEVFLRTGRTGISPEAQRHFLIEAMDSFGVAFVVVDDDRFVRDRSHPELRFPADYPYFRERISVAGTWGNVLVYRVHPPKLD